jgi:multicomponent Na+:H+ antiporter subunit B
MSETARRTMFFVGVAALAVFMFWGFAGLPFSGEYPGPYGDVMNAVANDERHVTDVVTVINFDYRGFDTLGEEFILFASVIGAAVLLRKTGEEGEADEEEKETRKVPATSDAVRFAGLSLIGLSVTFGIYVVTHGQLTPGGGFQGGVVLATAPLLVYLAGDPKMFQRIAPHRLVELGESAGALGYIAIGLLGLFMGVEFLRNVLPLGPKTTVLSGGTVPLISLTTGLEVSGGFILLLTVFLEEALERRLKRRS